MQLGFLKERMPPDKALQIERTVEAFQEGRVWDRPELQAMLQGQLRRLRRRGCPKALVEALRDLEGKVLEFVVGKPLVGVPILPVISRASLPLDQLARMVRYRRRPAGTHLDPSLILEDHILPQNPYFMVGVESGHAVRGLTPQESGELLRELRRHVMACEQVLAVATHLPVLAVHYLDAAASYYTHPTQTLALYVPAGRSQRPKLNWDFCSNRYERRGSPSYMAIVS